MAHFTFFYLKFSDEDMSPSKYYLPWSCVTMTTSLGHNCACFWIERALLHPMLLVADRRRAALSRLRRVARHREAADFVRQPGGSAVVPTQRDVGDGEPVSQQGPAAAGPDGPGDPAGPRCSYPPF